MSFSRRPDARFNRGRIVAASAAAFVPTSVSGIIAWYRPDLGVTLNGGDVSALADQSGTGDANKHATQANASFQPLYVASNGDFAGKPTIRFSRSNGDYLITGTWGASEDQPNTIYAVYKAGSNAFSRTVCDGLAGGSRHLFQNNSGTGAPQIFAGSFVQTVDDKSSTKVYACAVFNGASSALYVDDFSTAAKTGDASTNPLTGLVLGTDTGKTNALEGDLAELIVFAGVHSAATRALFQTYFARYT